jgi:hypothetical protein
MRTRRPIRCGAAMSPARRSTRATSRGRPRHRRFAAPKCHHRAGRRRRGATRLWARSHVRRLPPARVDQRSVRSRAEPSGTGASELQRPAPHPANPPRRSEERPASTRQLYGGSDRPDSDSLQRCRSRGRLSDWALTPSVPPVAKPIATPQRLQLLLIRGGGAPDVH